MDDFITVLINKNLKKSYPDLTKYLFKQAEYERVEAFGFLDTPKVFFLRYNYLGKRKWKPVNLDDIPANFQEDVICLFEDCLKNESYADRFLMQFVEENFDVLNNEIYSYYKEIFPQAEINLIDKKSISIEFKNDFDFLNLNESIKPRLNSNLNIKSVLHDYISAIDSKILNRIEAWNNLILSKRSQESKDKFVTAVIEKLNKSPDSSRWIFNINGLYTLDRNFFLGISYYNYLDFSKFERERFIVNESIGLVDYKFSYCDEYINIACFDILEDIKKQKIFSNNIGIFKDIENVYDIYNTNLIRSLHGARNHDFDLEQYVLYPKNSTVYIKGSLCSGKSEVGEFLPLNITYTDECNRVLKTLNEENFAESREFFFHILDKLNMNLDFVLGKGLLFGETVVHVTDNTIQREEDVLFPMPLFSDSLPLWKDALRKNLLSARREMKAKFLVAREAFYNEFEGLAGMFLTEEIISLLRLNPHLTETTICSVIKTKEKRGEYCLNYPDNCGNFVLFSSGEIKNEIKKLMSLDIVYNTVRTDGYFEHSVYDVNREIALRFQKPFPVFFKESFKKLQKGKALTDRECEVIFNEISKKDKKEISDFVYLLTLSKNKGFLSIYKDEFIETFSTVPNEVTSLLEMKIQAESDVYLKNIYWLILRLEKIHVGTKDVDDLSSRSVAF